MVNEELEEPAHVELSHPLCLENYFKELSFREDVSVNFVSFALLKLEFDPCLPFSDDHQLFHLLPQSLHQVGLGQRGLIFNFVLFGFSIEIYFGVSSINGHPSILFLDLRTNPSILLNSFQVFERILPKYVNCPSSRGVLLQFSTGFLQVAL